MSTVPINQTRFYQCGRKRLFLSEVAALKAARWALKRYGSRQEPYPCPHCGANGWHLRKVKNG